MKRIVAGAVAAIVLASVANEAGAQDVGNVQQGRALARMVCAECHAVETAQAPSPNSDAPAFTSVSRTAGMTAMALRVWLQTSHPTMPNIVLSSEERDNVVAYILSLRRATR